LSGSQIGDWMNQSRLYIVGLFLLFLTAGCDQDPLDQTDLPEIRIQPVDVKESDLSTDLFPYTIQLDKAFHEDVILYCSTGTQTAQPGEDYIELSEEPFTLPAGQTLMEIPIGIVGDTLMEFSERFEIKVQYDFHGKNRSARAVITIENDDYIHPSLGPDGYDLSLQYPGMQLFWQDEFDQETVNSEYWNFDAPNTFPVNCGGSDDAINKYTGDADHLKIRDGKLVLTASYDPATGIYRSSRVNSKEKVNTKYGRIDIRAKLAPGKGLASSLMMIGKETDWPAGGEIDVLKMAGKDCSSIFCSLVYQEDEVKTLEKKSSLPQSAMNLTDYFHLYSLLWEEDHITWLLDYSPYFTVSRETFPDEYIFNNAFFFKINLAVGGTFAGLPDPTTKFPSNLEVDYVRIYQPKTIENHDQ